VVSWGVSPKGFDQGEVTVSEWFPATNTPTSTQGEVAHYANSMQINLSPWDVVIEFQHQSVVGKGDDGTPQIASKVVERIVMSPHHAKAMHAGLGEAVAQWEANFGPLRDLRGLVPQVLPIATPSVTPKEGSEQS
jgi:hypothetical protein